MMRSNASLARPFARASVRREWNCVDRAATGPCGGERDGDAGADGRNGARVGYH